MLKVKPKAGKRRVKQILEDNRNIDSEGNRNTRTDGAADRGSAEIASLVGEAVRGSFEAFGRLYRLHVTSIYRYIFYQVRDGMLAEDITEDVFMRAMERIGSCAGKETTFRAWLYRIAHNMVVDHYRSNRRHLSIEKEETLELEDSGQNLEKRLEKQELLEVITELPRSQAQVILLKFIAGLENPEIARIMGKSTGAVRILQMRALASLRERLDGEKYKDG